MIFGTYMGLFWILKFILVPLGLTSPFLLLLFICLTICVPFMGYYYTKLYRNRVCDGSITFFHAWLFNVFMYVCASLPAHFGSPLHLLRFHRPGLYPQHLPRNACHVEP